MYEDDCFVIVVLCYNDFIMIKFLEGVLEMFKSVGVCDDYIEVFWVLGVWEILLVV